MNSSASLRATNTSSARRTMTRAVAPPQTAAVVSANICLPQNDQDKNARAQRVSELAATVAWDHDYLPGLAIAKVVPDYEDFTELYKKERYTIEGDVMPNAMKTIERQSFDPLDELSDYKDLFQTIPLPDVAKRYKSDASFAEQRLSGCNPLALRMLKSDDPRADVLRSLKLDPKDRLHYFNVEDELNAGNIYICDYTGTDPDYRGPSRVEGATTPVRKYLPKPLVFYRWDSNDRTGTEDDAFKPVAIQIDASSDPNVYTPTGARVYTPTERNKNDWFFAKICAQCADGNHHEMCSHLARCHFTMEPISIATLHCFDLTHPLSILLRVHMRFIMPNNFLAHGTFFKDHDGNLEKLLPGTLPETKQLLLEAYHSWGLKKHGFLQDLRNRGVDDTERLPHYPYRDDGLLLWNAIDAFVTSYVEYFYPSDQAVADDAELQAFAKECADPDYGRVKEMPTSFSTRSELIEVLNIIIFKCGPTHSAVNFTQVDYIAFTPNMPLAVYQNILEISRQTTPITDKQIMSLLPPLPLAMEQMSVVAAIGRYRYDLIGAYDKTLGEMYGKSFSELFDAHEPILSAMETFQGSLAEAEEEINRRNAKRPVPYRALLPSEVMNSISI